MSWTRIVSLPQARDLSEFCAYLYAQGVQLRVSEEGEQQVLWVSQPDLAEPVAELLERWLRGDVQLQGIEPEVDAAPSAAQLEPDNPLAWNRTPWTLLLLLLSIIGYAIVALDSNLSLVHWLTLQEFVLGDDYIGFKSVSYGLQQGQWWRLVTPIFLHFGLFHIIFNGLWVWELGRRIEALIGGAGLLRLALVSALVSNMVQYLWEGPSLFGGMSGVIYAFLGYIWLRHKARPHPYLAIPPGIIVFMLIWLLVCMTGALGVLAGIEIANGAHLGGLLVGMALGAFAAKRASGTEH